MADKSKSKYDDPKYLKKIGASEEFYKKSKLDIPLVEVGAIGLAGAAGMIAASKLKKNLEKSAKKRPKGGWKP
jgi:hypothetical protein